VNFMVQKKFSKQKTYTLSYDNTNMGNIDLLGIGNGATPEEYADKWDVKLVSTDVSEKGVFFAEFRDDDETFYHLLVEGALHGPKITNIRSRGNYTIADLPETGRTVMVDDDGVHEDW